MTKEVVQRIGKLEVQQSTSELDRRVEEIEAWFHECQEKYASQEEKSKREAWYQGLLQEGSRRKAVLVSKWRGTEI